MASQTTKLSISPREPEGSRATRRLRRSGRVPGVLYGGGTEPVAFSVDARELNIEALPAEIPESLTLDVSALEINDTITLADVPVPSSVVLLDDLETVVVTLTPPRLDADADEIESETERVGEGAGGGDASGDAGDSDSSD